MSAQLKAIPHSRGPWMYVRNAHTHSFRIESETLMIARMVGSGEESTANAALIAAAPDMAQALRNALRALNTVECPLSSMQLSVVADIERALAKAGL